MIDDDDDDDDSDDKDVFIYFIYLFAHKRTLTVTMLPVYELDKKANELALTMPRNITDRYIYSTSNIQITIKLLIRHAMPAVTNDADDRVRTTRC